MYDEATFTAAGPNTVNVVVQATSRVSGNLNLADPLLRLHTGTAYRSDDGTYAGYNADVPSGYAFDLAPGNYALNVTFIDFTDQDRPTGQGVYWTFGVDATDDIQQDITVPNLPVTVHFVDREGAPVTTYFALGCQRNRGFTYHTPNSTEDREAKDFLYYSANSAPVSSAQIYRPAPDGVAAPWSCYISYPTDDSGTWTEKDIALPTGDDLTVVLPEGVAYGGTTSDGPGDDGVAPLTEARGPNNGDGNGDGTPDADQANVTSLPANGAEYADGVPYMTIAGPRGPSSPTCRPRIWGPCQPRHRGTRCRLGRRASSCPA